MMFHKEGDGEEYFFEHGVDVQVFLGCGPRFCVVRGEVREDFVVGKDGGLGFKDLHGIIPTWRRYDLAVVYLMEHQASLLN